MRPLARIAALFAMATAATIVPALPAWAGGPAGPGNLVNGGEGQVFITVFDATVAEGDKGTVELRFPVTLSKASQSPIEVEVSTPQVLMVQGAPADAADKGVDFAGLDDQRVFPPGTTKLEVAVKVNGDTVHEGDEVVVLKVVDASAGVIADDSGAGTIGDDDPVPAVSIEDVSVAEGSGGATGMHFMVALANPSDEEVHVEVVPAAGSAVQGADWQGQPAQLTFQPGETAKDYAVSVVGDDVPELQESLTVSLGQVEGAVVADGTAVGAIDDDDWGGDGGAGAGEGGDPGDAAGGAGDEGPISVDGAGDGAPASLDDGRFSVAAAGGPASGIDQQSDPNAGTVGAPSTSGTPRTALALGLVAVGLALFVLLFAKGRRDRRRAE